ncbi:Asp-tRNA(Asn)/Glu-tRNA(Gln) amidotransferase subunit GatB [Caldinitratiruptor microaerophilus]|uniref:Aspartyl/glutamyl-tRNA(Asn/Gln) amidotransferase subunit B n=1 Tax=Caldinitratiruptor microaerophilus TaxID=671077 RepID=A0AA35CL67_9FIRM|nr:Asp-tRNA(Asn)/Glu-tRNA(Gln) amidotransferase subunit GatB [Caldinitratiruptor microaerophilus]BDG61247.1 aspartyl/glutamyl-tRNA(Asn/Gln) amidotransferase subunit B [Caldinitratiruptor microaerophilus]
MHTAAQELEFETVVGLEVHVELGTRSKIFCGCSTAPGAEPNTQTCPVCLGYPGVLPVLNEQALAYAIRAALALNCEIARFSKFDRKQYFYPDLPKGYQISQYDQPLAHSGWVEIEVGGETRRIGIVRVHLEEDAGKLLHAGGVVDSGASYVDFNRCGVPLIEIVSAPDIRSPEEARAYLEKLRAIMIYTGVSEARLEMGQMRADVNISVRPVGSTAFGTRTELKNLSSFRAVMRGIEYEARRQWEVIRAGGEVVQETRHFDEERGITLSLRGKEEAHDYRYFPEPDLPPVVLTDEQIEKIRAGLPELPDARKARYVTEYGLSAYDAGLIVRDKAVADFFEESVRQYAKGPAGAKTLANWVINELQRILADRGLELGQTPLTPAHLVGMLKLIDEGTISGKIGKEVFEAMVETGQEAAAIVKERGLVQVTDEAELAAIARQVIEANPKVVEDWRKGKAAAAQFLVGQVMKATRGRANPQLAGRLVRAALAEVTGVTNE